MVRPSIVARLAGVLAFALPVALRAQDPEVPRVIGRWDITVNGARGAYPAWLEIAKSGHATLVGRVMHNVGSARPIEHIDFDSTTRTFRFAVPRQWEGDTAELRVEGRLESGDDRMTG